MKTFIRKYSAIIITTIAYVIILSMYFSITNAAITIPAPENWKIEMAVQLENALNEYHSNLDIDFTDSGCELAEQAYHAKIRRIILQYEDKILEEAYNRLYEE